MVGKGEPFGMRTTMTRAVLAVSWLAVGLGGGHVWAAQPGQQPPTRESPVLAEARRLMDGFAFPDVVELLDAEIPAMTAAPDPDQDELAQAYDMRGRAHFNQNNVEQAAQDFELLLRARPDHALPDDVSPRISDLFNSVKSRLVGFLALSMPEPGIVTIDGRTYQVDRSSTIELLQGEHEFILRQPGFRDVVSPFTIFPGMPAELNVTMERTSGTLEVITVPAGTAVFVDDRLRGTTEPAANGGEASAPLLVDELLPGQHLLRLERDCFRTYENSFSVVNPPGDRTTGPLDLIPAVATASIQTTARDALIYVDGDSRGLAPAEVSDLCEGEHVIEVRAPSGRFVDRRLWDTGAVVTLDVDLKPAFALVEVAGSSDQAASDELTASVEAVLGSSEGVLIYAPTSSDLETARQDPRLGGALSAADATVSRRRDLAQAWSERLTAQGVAWLAAVDGESEVYDLFLLARDSGDPDRVRFAMGEVGSRAAAVVRLGTPHPPITRTTMHTRVVDVEGVEGAAVIHVTPGGVGEAAGLRPGDEIVGAAGTTVTSASALARVLADAEPERELPLEVRAADGAVRTASVRVALVPDTIPRADPGLLYNRILLDLQVLAETADSDIVRAASQLSLGIVHMRLGSWDLALPALQSVSLPVGPGVSAAAVDFLIGICLREIGQLPAARESFRRAVGAGEGTLSVGGPSVGPLAQRELDALP